MTFARRVFAVAGVYGLLVLAPMLFLEERVGRDMPPPIAHPEHYYGFVGVALAWQVVILIVSRDPVRYRPIMLAAVLEKLAFGVAVWALFAQDRVAALLLAPATVDLVLAVLFAEAWRRTGRRAAAGPPDGA